MFWQEETPIDQFRVPDNVVDLSFDVECKELPVDHAYALSSAIIKLSSWIVNDPNIGIHTIHVAGSQNGWERPIHNDSNRLILSHRTKLTIRTNHDKINALQQELTGQVLNIDDCVMRLGKAKPKIMSKNATLFARYVAIETLENETEFLQWVANELQTMNVTIRKAICGKTVEIKTSNGLLPTRSLLLADLSLEESICLQQRGLGKHKLLGCGIFIPHKSISTVKKIEN